MKHLTGVHLLCCSVQRESSRTPSRRLLSHSRHRCSHRTRVFAPPAGVTHPVRHALLALLLVAHAVYRWLFYLSGCPCWTAAEVCLYVAIIVSWITKSWFESSSETERLKLVLIDHTRKFCPLKLTISWFYGINIVGRRLGHRCPRG